MEDLLIDNERLSRKLDRVKDRMLEIGTGVSTTGSHDIMKEIIGLEEVNDNLKSLLLILHTNKATEHKHSTSTTIIAQLKLAEITGEVISSQAKIIARMRDGTITPKKTSWYKPLLTTKFMIPIVGFCAFFVSWLMHLISPGSFLIAKDFIINLF